MKLPNGCGSVIRLGKQIKKYLGTFQTRQEALNASANYNRNPFDVDLRKLTFAGLRKRHIQAVIDSCPLKVQTKSHMKSVCTQMYKSTKEESELHKPFSEAELAELWQNTEDTGAKVALVLCYTGLRPSELTKMKVADVHLPERYMQGGLKTKAGKPFHDLQTFRNRLWDNSSLLTNHLPHDGRHTCATLMDNAEVPLKIKQLILGHSSQDITSRISPALQRTLLA